MNNEPNSPSNEGSAQDTGNKEKVSAQYAAKSHETAEQLKAAAVGQAEEIKKKADTVKDQAVNRIRRVGSMLQSASVGLRSDDDLVAGYAERAAHQVDQIANYLGSTDPKAIAQDAQRVARENPALFFGGAFVVGLAAARFLKSSAAVSGSDYSGSGQSQRGAGYGAGSSMGPRPSTGSGSSSMGAPSGGRAQQPPQQRPRAPGAGGGPETRTDNSRTVPGIGGQAPRRPGNGDQVTDNPNRGAGR